MFSMKINFKKYLFLPKLLGKHKIKSIYHAITCHVLQHHCCK